MEEKRAKIIKWIKKDAVCLLVCGLYYFIIFLLDTTCLVKYFFKINCPTCGMTRAFISLIKLDFNGFLTYNYLVLPTVILLYLRLHTDNEKRKKVIDVLLIIDALSVLVKYFICEVFI